MIKVKWYKITTPHHPASGGSIAQKGKKRRRGLGGAGRGLGLEGWQVNNEDAIGLAGE